VHSSATDEDKATYVERACTGWYDYTNLVPIKREWRVWGDTALCNGDVRIQVVVKGTPKDFVSRYLQVWRRDADGWKMVSWQSTPVPAA
jgi:ketosteroid isomerase-like protein